MHAPTTAARQRPGIIIRENHPRSIVTHAARGRRTALAVLARVRRGGLQAGTFHWAGAIEASIMQEQVPSQVIPGQQNATGKNRVLIFIFSGCVPVARLRLRGMAASAVHLELGCMAPRERSPIGIKLHGAAADGTRQRRRLILNLGSGNHWSSCAFS